MSLRKKVIRLAYENPSLRKDLLPLVTKVAGRLEDYDFLGEILNLKRYAYGENGVFVDEGKYTLKQLQQILKKNRLTHLKIEENGIAGWHIH
tara:strand:+ start:35 stop:310 length:276 start_codon:yes stop_codon:yes gene_type:complete